MNYPHMFRVMDKDHKNTLRYVVIIAHSDFSLSDPWWLDEGEYKTLIKGQTFCPTIDLEYERHIFQEEKAAWEFIREWWSNPSLGII